MLVKECMTTRVITISPDSEILDAVKLMVENNISGLIVLDKNNKVVGVISESDIVNALKSSFPEISITSNISLSLLLLLKRGLEAYMEAKKLAKLKVKDLMTKKVFSVKPEDTIEEAARIMSEKDVKRLPVIDENNNLVGIISRSDILKALMKE
ncbi:MAG: CBS domain-containing protein [Candidatus Aenigmatarchaeota archaeon]